MSKALGEATVFFLEKKSSSVSCVVSEKAKGLPKGSHLLLLRMIKDVFIFSPPSRPRLDCDPYDEYSGLILNLER